MAGSGEEARIQASELRCPNCGAPWTMRGFSTTRTLACEHCGAVIDTSGDEWQLVETVEKAYKTKPRYALGTRGTYDGIEWEVIGWARRSVRSFGRSYPWEEHLLYNPYEGFAYLIYQDGHFVFVRQVPGAPSTSANRATYRHRTYKHFSTADAVVDEVLGEFPWEVRRGDVASATDYVAPPHILSCEESEGEQVWSEGRYVEPEEVITAFGSPTRALRSRKGIHPCQPNPARPLAKWMAAVLGVALCAWFVLTLVYLGSRDSEVVWTGRVPKGQAVVTDPFEVGAGAGTVELAGHAAVRNSWTYVNAVLVGPIGEAEEGRYAGLEISYYYGSDWSEGSQDEETVIGNLPPGRYRLQLEVIKNALFGGPVDITVTRDVVLWRYPCCSFLLLLVMPAFVLTRSAAFEGKRWQESDHAPG